MAKYILKDDNGHYRGWLGLTLGAMIAFVVAWPNTSKFWDDVGAPFSRSGVAWTQSLLDGVRHSCPPDSELMRCILERKPEGLSPFQAEQFAELETNRRYSTNEDTLVREEFQQSVESLSQESSIVARRALADTLRPSESTSGLNTLARAAERAPRGNLQTLASRQVAALAIGRDNATALVAYRRAVANNPNDWVALNQIGLILMRTGDNVGARSSYNDALRVASRLTNDAQRDLCLACTYANLATLDAQIGDSDSAFANWRRAYDHAVSSRRAEVIARNGTGYARALLDRGQLNSAEGVLANVAVAAPRSRCSCDVANYEVTSARLLQLRGDPGWEAAGGRAVGAAIRLNYSEKIPVVLEMATLYVNDNSRSSACNLLVSIVQRGRSELTPEQHTRLDPLLGRMQTLGCTEQTT